MDLNNKSFKDELNDLTKKLDDIEKEEEGEWEQPTLTPEEQEEQDRNRYQSAKKDYYQHDSKWQKSSMSQCVVECDYFPDDGIQTEDGKIFYDDPNLDPEFYNDSNALDQEENSSYVC